MATTTKKRRTMKARYRTRCSCGGTITPGETITKSGSRWVCSDCAGGGGEYRSYKGLYGRCEDAPCCGCCGPQGDGDYYGYGGAY